MSTFVLIHGAGGSSWSWSYVVPELEHRGHQVVAVDLPCEDDDAGIDAYLDATLAAIGDRRDDLVVVGHSLGGFTAPLVCDRLPVSMLVYVTAMVGAPGESMGAWWETTGCVAARQVQIEADGGNDDDVFTFLQDVPAEVIAASEPHLRRQSGRIFDDVWPLAAQPDVPTRFLLCTQDRFFPASWMRGVVRDRLGIEPDELDAGHVPMLGHPVELAERLHAYRVGR